MTTHIDDRDTIPTEVGSPYHAEYQNRGNMKRKKTQKTHLSSTSSSKRKVVGEAAGGGGRGGAVVGMKFSSTSNNASAIGQSQQKGRPRQEFLKTHLQILKTLYHTSSTKDHDKSQDVGGDDDNSNDEDGPVQHDEWKSIDDFLLVRDRLQTLSHQVERMGGIHQEAEKFQHTMDKKIQKQQKQFAQQQFVQQQQQQQTAPTNIHASPLRKSPKGNHHPFPGSGSGSKKNRVNRDGHYHRSGGIPDNSYYTMTNNNSSVNSAGIMSALLRRKHYIAYKHWKKQVEPFRDLSTKIMQRIDALNEQRTALSSDMIRQNLNLQQGQQQQKKNVENKETQARIETKIDLWNILRGDLKAACRNDMAKWSQELTESQQW